MIESPAISISNGQNEMEIEDKHAAQNLESKPTICYSLKVYMVNHDGCEEPQNKVVGPDFKGHLLA